MAPNSEPPSNALGVSLHNEQPTAQTNAAVAAATRCNSGDHLCEARAPALPGGAKAPPIDQLSIPHSGASIVSGVTDVSSASLFRGPLYPSRERVADIPTNVDAGNPTGLPTIVKPSAQTSLQVMEQDLLVKHEARATNATEIFILSMYAMIQTSGRQTDEL